MQPIFTGAIKDTPDPRDFQLKDIAGDSAPFDWAKGYDVEKDLGIKIKVKDQGNSYSCGGQAWSYYGAVLRCFILGLPYEEFSAKFIYSQTFVPGGGSGGRENCAIVIKQGFGTEALTPSYENGNVPSEAFMQRPQDITDAAREVAKKNLALSYATPGVLVETIAKSTRDFKGTIIGLTGNNNGTWRSAFPQPPARGEWNHWLYVGKAKMINGKRHFGVLNSWGESTGEQGWQWISEDYFTNDNIWSSWTIVPKKVEEIIKPSHTFNTDLRYGSRGPEVKALQQCLIYEGKLKAGYDTGYFGDYTFDAVKLFQQENAAEILAPFGLTEPNGKVLTLTRKKLNSKYGK